MLIAIVALASCSTQKVASNQHVDDDVYFTKAKAGEQVPMQIAYNQNVYTTPQDNSGTYSDDDYYYYDSYASRINRFSYNSPFNYYDDYYYDYTSTPTYGGYAGYDLNSYAYGGYGLGVGIGFGFGGYYGYSPFGIGWGGGYPYWGIYSAYGYGYPGYWGGGYYGGGYGYGGGYRGTPRPYRGSGVPGGAYANRSVRGVGYNGAYQNAGYYPGRAVNSNGRRITTNGYGNNGNYNNGQQGRQTRPTRTDYPTYQPTRTTNSMPSSSGGGGNSGGGGGGGSRPVRP